jgi:hypothetical protein
MTLVRFAKAMFATDERVKKFVAEKAERPDRMQAVLRAAWNTDEQGWRTETLKRVAEMDRFVREGYPKPTSSASS